MKRALTILACLIVLSTSVGCIHKHMLLVTPYRDGDARSVKMADGLLSSETLIAFRTFSKHDLDRMFSVGLE